MENDWKNSEIATWFRKDKFSIILTIACAFLPMVFSSLPNTFFKIPQEMKILLDREERNILTPEDKATLQKFNYYRNEQINSAAQGIFVMIAIGAIMLSYQPTTLRDVSDKRSLQQYIEEVCRLRQTTNNTSENAYRVVKITVRQFYHFWIAIWWIWMIYYIGDYLLFQTGCYVYMRTGVQANMRVVKTFLDLCNSAAIFGVYFILSNTTVDISTRSRHPYRNLYSGISFVMVILLVFVVLQAIRLSNPYDGGLMKYDIYTEILLGAFSALSLVLVLGRFNSKYLRVPRPLMYILYAYAISQIFVVFNHIPDKNYYGVLTEASELIGRFLPWMTFFGKITLFVTMSWILFEKRFIFYIIHRSLLNTEIELQLKEFKRYMS